MIRERHPGTFFFAKHTWFVHKYKSQAKKLRQKKPITCQKRPFLQASNLILAMGSMLRLILRFILDMRNRRIMGCKNGPSATHSTLHRRKRHLKFNFDISNTNILQKKSSFKKPFQIGKGPCPTTKRIPSATTFAKHDITRTLNWKYCATIVSAVHDQAYSPNSIISKNCEGCPVSSVAPSCHFNQYHILRYNCICLKAISMVSR